MKSVLLAVCAFTVICGCAVAQAPDLSKMDLVEKSVPNGPVAVIDGAPISGADYLALYRSQIKQLSAMAGADKVSDEIRLQTGVECIRRLIRERLLMNEAAKRGLTVSDAEAQAEYNKQLSDMQQDALEKTKAKLSEEDFLKQIGMTRDEVLKHAKEDMLLGKVREALLQGKDVNIPDADVKKFYDNNPERFSKPGGIRLKQIFIRPEGGDKAAPKAWEAAEKAAQKALARVRAGETFETVAREVSNSPDAQNGGLVAVPELKNLPPFYQSAMAKMKPGDLSDLIKSEHGYHFFVYVSSSDDEKITLDKAEDRIRGLLKRVKEEDVLDNYLQPIEMDPNRVEIYLNIEKNLPDALKQKAAESSAAAAAQPAPAAKAAPAHKKK